MGFNMQTLIINYYKKITDLALKNIAQEKKFSFKQRLNSSVMMQSEDHLLKVFSASSGGKPISAEARKIIDDYKDAMKKMNLIAVKDYNDTLSKLKNAKPDDKEKILKDIAKRGFKGFKSKNGAIWNIETYTNMYFTHINNQMIRLGALEAIESDKIMISSHGCDCELCMPWEGKIMTRSELDNAIMQGLFHPNCIHVILEVV